MDTGLPLGTERQQMPGIFPNMLEGIICHLGVKHHMPNCPKIHRSNGAVNCSSMDLVGLIKDVAIV